MDYMIVNMLGGTAFREQNVYVGKMKYRVIRTHYEEYLRLHENPTLIGNVSLIESNRLPLFKLHVISMLNQMNFVFENDRQGYIINTANRNAHHGYSSAIEHSYGYLSNAVQY